MYWAVVIPWKTRVRFQPATSHNLNSKALKCHENHSKIHLWAVAWLHISNLNSSLVYIHRTPFSGSTASRRANCACISTISHHTITSTSISPLWSTMLQVAEWKEPTCFPMSFRTCRQIPVTITTAAWCSRCGLMMVCSSGSKRLGNSRDLIFGNFFYFINVKYLYTANQFWKMYYYSIHLM